MTIAEIKQAAEVFATNLAFRNPTKEILLSVKNIIDLKRESFIAGAEANVPIWIPVRERMPDEQTYYLVIANKGSIFLFHYDLDSDGIVKWWYGDHPAQAYMQPTHWMPLPSPPNQQP